MATLIAVTRPTGGDLTVYGAKTAGTPSLTRDGLQLPSFPPVVDTASARWLDGEIPTAVRSANGVLGLKVRIEAATESAHDTIVEAWRVALRQLSYETTVTLGDRATTYLSLPGTISVAGQQRLNLPGLVVDWYNLQIPVQPNPVVV